MEISGIIVILALLFVLLIITGLLALQIWLAGRRPMLGLVQPLLWAVMAVMGNILPRLSDASLESGVYALGAIVMLVLSLVTFLFARWRLGS